MHKLRNVEDKNAVTVVKGETVVIVICQDVSPCG